MDIDKIVKGQAVKLRIDHLTGNLSEIECKTFLNNFLKAINYTQCCEKLPYNKSKEISECETCDILHGFCSIHDN